MKTKRQLQAWVSRGVDYAKSLPAKARSGSARRAGPTTTGPRNPLSTRTPTSARLARYVEEFDTVELNASFYRWPKDATFAGWREHARRSPMSVKAHRGLTHFRRLRSPEPWIERFEQCWTALGERREALLVQLHPDQQRDDTRPSTSSRGYLSGFRWR